MVQLLIFNILIRLKMLNRGCVLNKLWNTVPSVNRKERWVGNFGSRANTRWWGEGVLLESQIDSQKKKVLSVAWNLKQRWIVSESLHLYWYTVSIWLPSQQQQQKLFFLPYCLKEKCVTSVLFFAFFPHSLQLLWIAHSVYPVEFLTTKGTLE